MRADESASHSELQDWFESLQPALEFLSEKPGTRQRPRVFLDKLVDRLRESGIKVPHVVSTPYINTIPPEQQPAYPGDREIERRIKSLMRWNAMAMVVKANSTTNVGGHISTFASSATLYEVGLQSFFPRARRKIFPATWFIFRATPRRAFMRAPFWKAGWTKRICKISARNWPKAAGLSSYPHPYLMPDFWQFPTVSMGLGPIMSLYQARFNRYLQARGLVNWQEEPKVWAFLGDGESDEPETLGAITLGARENLDNLDLGRQLQFAAPRRPGARQRQNHPGTGRPFPRRGLECHQSHLGQRIGTNCSQRDKSGLLLKRMEECVDGDFQKYSVEPGSYTRKHFFGKYPELLELVNHLTDEQIRKLLRGGHDPRKVYAAYKAAMEHKGQPTVILAKTVKGYGLGEAGEGKQHLAPAEKNERKGTARIPRALRHSDQRRRDCRNAVLSSAGGQRGNEISAGTPQGARRFCAGAHCQAGRRWTCRSWSILPNFSKARQLGNLHHDGVWQHAERCCCGTKASAGTSCRSFLTKRARSAWMRLFREIGIYSSKGQLYEPVDKESLLYYHEAKDGQILEEGITEAGSMASFIAAGTSYATHGVPMIPFYIYYSMFGPQRVGDLFWLAGDIRAKGFLLGATAGRTTLNGEGLQHQDGHSLLHASTIPTCLPYDPAFGLRTGGDHCRRFAPDVCRRTRTFSITSRSTTKIMPCRRCPPACEDGILKGLV